MALFFPQKSATAERDGTVVAALDVKSSMELPTRVLSPDIHCEMREKFAQTVAWCTQGYQADLGDWLGFTGSDNLCVPLLDVDESDDSSNRSSEHQDCSVSDFNISDMIFSGSPIERNLAFDDNVDSMFLHDYKCEESNIFCDLAKD